MISEAGRPGDGKVFQLVFLRSGWFITSKTACKTGIVSFDSRSTEAFVIFVGGSTAVRCCTCLTAEMAALGSKADVLLAMFITAAGLHTFAVQADLRSL